MRPRESRAQQALLQAKGRGGEFPEPRGESRAHGPLGRATRHRRRLDPVPGQGQKGGREVTSTLALASVVPAERRADSAPCLAETNGRAIFRRMTKLAKGDRTRSRILDEAVQLAS